MTARASIKARLGPGRVEGFARERLTRLAAEAEVRGLGLIIAPAGAGKTTLLAQLATRSSRRVAWYTLQETDGEPESLLRTLKQNIGRPSQPARDWADAEQSVLGLEPSDEPMLLVVDDLHTIVDTPAERTLERIIERTSPTLSVLAASRIAPSFDLTRRRLAGSMIEISSDELRFRVWEVERLFREFYREPLSPEDVAELTRRTDGWAAGLQLFHLATTGRAPIERHLTLRSLPTRARLVREYLACNVLAALPSDVRSFLLDTCVLGRVSGPLCDELLGRADSVQFLTELEKRQLFLQRADDEDVYRYHEVLRRHLEMTFLENVGEEEARHRYLVAGELLERDGALPEALRAYGHAQAWTSIQRLVRKKGGHIADQPACWLDALPPTLRDHDPWLLLAAAREDRVRGRWHSALETYRRAEDISSGAAEDLCSRERSDLGIWLDAAHVVPPHWGGALRSATMSQPLVVAQRLAASPTPNERLAAGLSALLAGSVTEARRDFETVIEDHNVGTATWIAGRVATAVSAFMGDDETGISLAEAVAEDADRAGMSGMARAARAVLALSVSNRFRVDATWARTSCEQDGDLWGALLFPLLEAFGSMRRGEDPLTPFEAITAEFEGLGARTLAAWSESLRSLALARRGDPEGQIVASAAETRARFAGIRGAQAIALLALAEASPDQEESYMNAARAIAQETGFGLPIHERCPSAPRLGIRCFGGFEITVRGRRVQLSLLKPRVRSLLRLLALHAGKRVHREILIEALWPEIDPEAGRRNLHVAISSLRSVLDGKSTSHGSSIIVREGDSYCLGLSEGGTSDVVEFEQLAARLKVSVETKDRKAAASTLRTLLDVYRSGLLTEDGPADWVVDERERLRMIAVQAVLAVANLMASDPATLPAVPALCREGLHIDRFNDALWRSLSRAHLDLGEQVAAAQVRNEYGTLLAQLGVPTRTSDFGSLTQASVKV